MSELGSHWCIRRIHRRSSNTDLLIKSLGIFADMLILLQKIAINLARGVLFLLVFIHFILPFTPANPHPELQIKIGSLILGTFFLALGVWSLKSPFSGLGIGLLLLLLVYFVSSTTGASPITEGLPVKVVFVVILFAGIMITYKRKNNFHHR